MPDEFIRNELLLSLVSGVGPRLRTLLLERFESAEAVLNAAPSELRSVPGIGPKLAGNISRAKSELDPDREIELCRERSIDILTQAGDRYPPSLKEIPDPPPMLFMQGQIEARDALAIAIVGTRHATAYGLRQTERLASSLARAGFTIISGLARGVDAAAHRGALKAGGRTIAVLGSGLLNLYPPEHGPLYDEIAKNGAVLSESPPETPPQAGLFPQRNRIVSGMSLGVIIIEAAERSGALITARLAYEQGREVFALPGPVDSRMSKGCHQLLRDGATLVASADDVLETLGPLATPVKLPATDDGEKTEEQVRHPAELQLNDIERRVLNAIEPTSTTIDKIVAAAELPVHQVLSTVSVLEMRRLIRRTSGNSVCRI